MRDIKIALRNLTRQKKRTILLSAAIAFGIFIITMINGFTGSFIDNVSENFSNLMAGHIFLDGVEKTETGKTLSLVRDDEILIASIEDTNVPWKYITKRSDLTATLIFEGENLQQSITGADWKIEEYFKERVILKEGSFDDLLDERQGVILSEVVAEQLKLEIGDRMLVKCRTFTGQQNVGEFVLVATMVDTGLLAGTSAYGNISYVNELLNLEPDEYMTMGIFLEDMELIDPVAEELYEDLSGRVSMFERNTDDEDENPIPGHAQSGGRRGMGRSAFQDDDAERYYERGSTDCRCTQHCCTDNTYGAVRDYHGRSNEHLSHGPDGADKGDRHYACRRNAAGNCEETLSLRSVLHLRNRSSSRTDSGRNYHVHTYADLLGGRNAGIHADEKRLYDFSCIAVAGSCQLRDSQRTDALCSIFPFE